MPNDELLRRLRADLGFRPLNRTWAKLEVLLGSLAPSTGILAGVYGMAAGDQMNWGIAVGGVVLSTLGSYLALAGHRSHTYQSGNALAAWIVGRLQSDRSDVHDREESPK